MKDNSETKEKKHSIKGNPPIKLLLLLLLLVSLLVSAYGVGVAVASYVYNTRYEGKRNVLHNLYDSVGYADAVQVYQRTHSITKFDSLINDGANFEYIIREPDGMVSAKSNPALTIDEDDYRTLHFYVPAYYYNAYEKYDLEYAASYIVPISADNSYDYSRSPKMYPGDIYGLQRNGETYFYMVSYDGSPDLFYGNVYEGDVDYYLSDDYYALKLYDGIWPVSADVFLFIDVDRGFFDRYYVINMAVDQMYTFGYWALMFTFAGLVLALFFNVLLCGMAGRYGKNGELKDNILSKVWIEVPIALITGYACFVCYAIYEIGERLITIPVAIGGIIIFILCLSLFVMNVAHRIKVGRFWHRSLIGLVLIGLWKGLVFVGRSLWHLLSSMRLMARTALAALIFIAAATIVLIIGCSYPYNDLLCVFCVLAVIFIVIFMFVVSYMLKKLQRGIDNLAKGEFNEKTDTKHLFPTFKTAAQKINVASDGMNKAVEERIKSERMRTELITNVSHDIKTPLTSIINYSDLILSEQVDNEKVNEYAEVLHRQGERLKRLLEDLLEASKASTGNLEVVLGPCELNVLVSQVAAEYEEKFAGAGLKLVTELPEQESTILADGRRLSRVLDNLLNNACKYSLTGTRVYMSVDVNDEFGRIIIKNTSKSELNVSPDELMERFVRGDASRTTEGSGLGLSIAQSLTELQGGKLQLAIDGDLFKAIVCMKRDNSRPE